MIFTAKHARLVKQGRKTQTRRVANTTECRYRTGKTYALQPGRGRAQIGRITVTSVRREPLGAITFEDARREGYRTTTEFRDAWTSIHRRFDPDLSVWVITFAFGDRTDTDRYLAAVPGAPHGDYVTQPFLGMQGEPAAVSEGEQEAYSKLGHARDAHRMADPLRMERDSIARALERLSDLSPSPSIRDSIRRLHAELRVLDRKLAA